MKNYIKTLALALGLGMAAACGDLAVENLNAPDRTKAITTPNDVEALISGGFANWHRAGNYSVVALTMTCLADGMTSSWGNFGWRHACSEPRVAWNNEPSWGYAYLTDNTWTYSYRALAGMRDGLVAIEGGVTLDEQHRAQTYAAFTQGLVLTRLANTFDQAFIITEETDLSDPNNLPTLASYMEVHQAGMARLDQAISMAGQGSFSIPQAWVGFEGDWDNARLMGLANGYKARNMISVARDEASRTATDWNAVLAAVAAAHTDDYDPYYDGDNWVWSRLKHRSGGGGYPGWNRLDMNFVGVTDQSGNYQAWLNTPLEQRQAFQIDTDDRRITDGTPTGEGLYARYWASIPFRPERGTYHFSHYGDNRWRPLWENDWIGNYTEFPVKELDFIKAEALYRTGDMQGALEIVNKYRTMNGQLPPATLDGVSGPRCTPRRQYSTGGECADFWEVLKYEKAMEIYNYGAGTAFYDDRGWGDLISGSPIHFPVPGSELDLLLLDIYTFGGGGPGSAPRIFNNSTDDATIRWKREALEAFDQAMAEERLHPGAIR